MTVGFVILAHGHLDRVAELALGLASQGAPIAIHIDRRVSDKDFYNLKQSVSEEDVIFADRVKCEWGMFNIVKATQTASKILLQTHPEINHVYLLSGSCLPTRPIAQLRSYLNRYPDTDFIESFHLDEQSWIKGGLTSERFDFFFPIGWRKHSKVFEALTALQRKVGIKRTPPKKIHPFVGSQWWCLTRKTLTKILEHKDKRAIDRYFRWALIPDESYFQTLTRRYSKEIDSRSLTLSVFDGQGRPALLYDDHLEHIQNCNAFFVRKVWPKANALYSQLLAPNKLRPLDGSKPDLRAILELAATREDRSEPGITNMGNYRTGVRRLQNVTPSPYFVLTGFAPLFSDTSTWLNQKIGLMAHGSLFSKASVELALGVVELPGNVTNNKRIRNLNPAGFLVNVLRSAPQMQHAFLYDSFDQPRIRGVIAKDTNAHIIAIQGAWIAQLTKGKIKDEKLLVVAQRYLRLERTLLRKFLEDDQTCKVKIYSILDLVSAPSAFYRNVSNDLSGEEITGIVQGPTPHNLAELKPMIQRLERLGMNLDFGQQENPAQKPVLVENIDLSKKA